MSEMANETALFFEQQVELYGNEIVFDISAIRAKSANSNDEENVQWHSSASLSEFEGLIFTCEKCDLHKSRTRFVFGKGNENADVMLVGEAPGTEEDRRGEPIAGQADELLTKMLAAINLSRDQVYTTNILKCRAPLHREPSPTEIESCRPYLEKQVQLISPKIVICLGQIAAHALLQSASVLAELRGQIFEFNDVAVFVTYHPTALLNDASLKRGAWEDLQRIQQFLKVNGMSKENNG